MVSKVLQPTVKQIKVISLCDKYWNYFDFQNLDDSLTVILISFFFIFLFKQLYSLETDQNFSSITSIRKPMVVHS